MESTIAGLLNKITDSANIFLENPEKYNKSLSNMFSEIEWYTG